MTFHSVSLGTLKRLRWQTPSLLSRKIATMADAVTPSDFEDVAPKKLSPAEFRAYNRCAEHMDYFHNRFRHSWKTIYSACENNKRPSSLSIPAFIKFGLDFCHHLTTHHTIEEQYIFPVLARKMPKFREELEMLTHHKAIHKGVDQMERFLESCQSGESELRLDELKKIMDGFGTVLWEHLDAEVKELGANNMAQYWTLQEMNQIPM